MSWTVSYFRRYRPFLGLSALLQLRSILLKVHRGAISFDERLTLRLKSPSAVSLTIRPATNDYHTFDEVFVDQVYSALLHGVEGCRTVVDLGANIGLTSLYLSSHFPEASFVVVEPDRENCALLERNLASLIRRRRCTVINGAAWGKSEPLTLSGGDEDYHVNGRQFSAESRTGEGSTRTQGYTVTEILVAAGFESVDLLKMDIEGSETSIFQGDTSWLSRVKRLAVEFHDDSRRESGFDALMERYGFRVEDETDHTVVAARVEEAATVELGSIALPRGMSLRPGRSN